MKKITIALLAVFMLAGCSTKRDVTFKTDKMEFENGKTEQVIEVEGKNIETYLPKVESEYQPFVLGWVDESGKDVDVTNVSKKNTTLTVKWDDKKIQDYEDTKEAEKTIVKMNKYIKVMNQTPGAEVEYKLDETDGKKVIFGEILITDKDIVASFTDPKIREAQKSQFLQVFEYFNLIGEEIDVYNDTKFPIGLRIKLKDGKDTLIYESISGEATYTIYQ